MKRRLALILVLMAGAAQAAEGGQGWSVLSGQTVGAEATVITGAMGWPGISATLLKGVTPKIDIGGRFTFNYGFEGIVTRVTPGLKLQGVLRVALHETGKVNIGVNFAPGPLFYFEGGGTLVGLQLPVGFVVGIPAGSAVMLNLGMDFPLFVLFGQGGGVALPILVGAGGEYFIDQRLSVSFNTRMGPTVGDVVGRRSAPFTLVALVGVALKL